MFLKYVVDSLLQNCDTFSSTNWIILQRKWLLKDVPWTLQVVWISSEELWIPGYVLGIGETSIC